MVSEPVIRSSPMLTQDDLVILIASGPPRSTVMAVANRPGIGTAVCDVIVGTAEPAAIRALLCNQTAQMREATLDALAAESEQQADWREPLVRRPHLSAIAQRMLSEILTGHLLRVLAARSDLDPKIGESLQAALALNGHNAPSRHGHGVDPADVDLRTAVAEAETLQRAGRLDDHMILDALRVTKLVSAKAMLAVKAGVTMPTVERACALHSARALVSLAWKAGFSAQTAAALQTMMANLEPDQVLRPTKNANFALSEDEMRWQLAFLDGSETEPQAWMPRRL
jgi:uncharacterized protein (DUF2336 family)